MLSNLSYSHESDVTDISLPELSSSDVSYLNKYDTPVTLGQTTCLDAIGEVTTVESDVPADSDVLDPSSTLAEYSGGDLRQQFSDLKMDSDGSKAEFPSSDANNIPQPPANLLGLMNVPNDMAHGLKVVGTIPVTFPTTHVSTTLSYATPLTTVQGTDIEPTNEVRLKNNLVQAFVATSPLQSTGPDNLMSTPIEVQTPTMHSPNVYVLSLMVEDADKEQIFKTPSSKGKEDALTENKNPNPLEMTITAAPEPQCASTPNVVEDHQKILNETIVAGFSSESHF